MSRKHWIRCSLFLLCGVVTALLLSCGGINQSTTDEAAAEKLGYWLLLWKQDVGDMNKFLQPTRDGDFFCVISRSGQVSFINLDGEEVYSTFSVQNSLDDFTAGAGCGEGVVSAVNAIGILHVYDYSGLLLWQKDLKTRVFGAPLIHDGRLMTFGLDGRLLAHTARQDRLLWSYVSPLQNLLRTPVDSSLVVDDNTIYAGIDNGAIVALRASDGRVLWENSVAFPSGSNSVANILDVTTPVVRGDVVCAGAYQGGVACFAKDGGELLWRFPMSVASRVSFDAFGSRLFVSDLSDTLYSFDARTGELLWRQENTLSLSNPSFVTGVVVVGDSAGHLHALHADTGVIVDQLDLQSSNIIHLQSLEGHREDVIGLTSSGDLFRARFVF